MRIVVVDLDGTLCNSNHRQHLAQAKEWDQFHSLAVEDDPNWDVAELISLLSEQTEMDVCSVYLTARNEAYRIPTVEWCRKRNLTPDILLMRPVGNFESDAVIKPRLLEDFLRQAGKVQSDVWCILEDRDKMVEAWRNLGYNCWQVRASGY